MISIKKKIIIFISASIVFLALAVYFIIVPTIRDINEINNTILMENRQLNNKINQGQLIRKVLADYKTILPEIEKLDSMFIQENEEIRFVTDLEKISQQYNIDGPKLGKLTIEDSPNAKKETIQELPLRMDLNGDFREVLKFLSHLESISYYFIIESVNIASRQESQGKINATFDGKVFIQTAQQP